MQEEIRKNTELHNKNIKLERSKNNYFINISHELRTPLNIISSTNQLIQGLARGKNDIKKDDKILQRDKEDQEIKNMFNEQNKEEHQKEFDNFMKMPEINDNKNNVDFMINDLLGDNYFE